jgi:DNA mismatch repair protein MutL
MSDIIQLLPDNVANQIAAGEVVQRPASIVKELLENAIDAGATEIKLLIKDAGKTLVQVIDNGKGMSMTDARLCFERHATSKIKTAEDLFNLHTKGFRGEALASIAAVAHVEIKTRQGDLELGTHIKIEGSKVLYQEVISTPQGTSIAVKNIFYNIPARRKFLKSNSIETRHIINEFNRVALAHPTLNFVFYNSNSETFNYKANKLKKRIIDVFGEKINEKLFPIDENTDIISIKGFVSKPEFTRKKKGDQFFFVNDRFIKNGYLHHAVMNAFEGLLSSGYHPSYFLYLKVPANSIDINIHPTKTEIKFENEQVLYAIIRSTIKHSLGQYNISPILDFNRNSNLDIPYNYKDKLNIQTPKIKYDPDFNPFISENIVNNKPEHNETLANLESFNAISNSGTIQNIEVEAEIVTQNLFDDLDDNIQVKTFQVHQKFILSVIKSGLICIAQNYAHQRILYEEFLTIMTIDETASQQLLFPMVIEFTKSEINLCKEMKSDLESAGFQFDSIEQDTILLSGIPTNVNPKKIKELFDELFETLLNEIPDSSFSQIDTIAKSLSKSLAIKNGVKLSNKEQEELIGRLFSCTDPIHSPYGKRTYISIPFDEIELKFDN